MDKQTVINFDSWKIKRTQRTRDRMKLQIKLSKEEGLAFKNFMEMVKPPEISEEDFMKGLFKIGIETMESKLLEAVKEHAAAEGIDLTSAEGSPAPEEIIVPVVGEVSELKAPKEVKDELPTSKTN